MKPQELRIGNYVTKNDPKLLFITCNDSDIRQDVDLINELDTGDQVGVFNDGNFNSSSYFQKEKISNIKPIPLTQEWLLKLGFNKKRHKWHDNTVSDDLYWLEKFFVHFYEGNPSLWMYYENKTQVLIKDCPYVHVLQNLYFNLTGHELPGDIYKI